MAATIKNSPAQKAIIEERRVNVFKYRRAGSSLREIAALVGVSYVTVKHDLDAMLKKLAAEQSDHAERYRALELERLDMLQIPLWTIATDMRKDEVTKRDLVSVDTRLIVIDRLLKISERRSKLLGLDAPVKAEITGKDSGPIEIKPIDYRQAVASLAPLDEDGE